MLAGSPAARKSCDRPAAAHRGLLGCLILARLEPRGGGHPAGTPPVGVRPAGLEEQGGRRHHRDADDGRSAKFRQNVARFRLYRHRSLQENTRFSAFFKIYQIIQLKILKFGNILQILQHLQNFC